MDGDAETECVCILLRSTEYSVFVWVNSTATEDCVPVNSPVGHQDTLSRGCILVTYVRT